VFVIDGPQSELVVLREGQAALRWTTDQLRLRRLAAIAVDERTLALADPLLGQVSLFLIEPQARR